MTGPERLLQELARLRAPGAAELQAALGVSRATLSRLVESAGESVVRMGRARATRYARTRKLPGLPSSLPVFEVDERGATSLRWMLHPLWGGSHWLASGEGEGTLFEGLPPFAADMSPQGYLGRGFAARHPELGLPARLWDWNDDHRLVALAKRGEDCVGNLIVGDESLHRFISAEMVETARERFPELAHRAAVGEGGSSAGGEHPKFGAYAGGRHVLVKFASGEGDVARRWRDLLWCEWRTLQVLTEEGFSVTKATCFDVEGHRFLEAERFDRAGERGRRGLLSLYSIDNEYFGSPDNWTKAALRLQSSGRLSTEDARTLRWWDTFGELAGNTDRHFGNVSFFPEVGGQLRLAPAYDMLPMILAPSLTEVVERPFAPRPPTSDNLDVWPQAAKAAVRYWGLVAAEASLQESVRRYAEVAGRTVETLLGRVEPAH